MFDKAAYLALLGVVEAPPSAMFLRQLHRSHLENIPYNNIDILIGKPYDLSEKALFDKVVRRRRGGFCYELAPLFLTLLRELGFTADLLSARIVQPDGTLGPEFDHGVLAVHLERRWLADIGNSRWFVDPLCIDDPDVQQSEGRFFRIEERGDTISVFERDDNLGERLQYTFTMHPAGPLQFDGMCRHKWTSPESKFVRGLSIARVMNGNRIVVNRERLITREGQRSETMVIPDTEALRSMILELFGSQLDCSSFLDQLLQPNVLDALTL
jgi:N-hydroxyarylamine O-acetyltransferase